MWGGGGLNYKFLLEPKKRESATLRDASWSGELNWLAGVKVPDFSYVRFWDQILGGGGKSLTNFLGIKKKILIYKILRQRIRGKEQIWLKNIWSRNSYVY